MAYNYRYDDEPIPAPVKLKEDRNFWKVLALEICTCGVYGLIYYIQLSHDLQKITSHRGGEKSMSYILAYILGLFTGGAVKLYWFWGTTDRVEKELFDRDIHCDFSNKDFWGWLVIGSYFLFLIGPYVYHYKLLKAMNLLCHDYNEKAEQEHREFLKRR